MPKKGYKQLDEHSGKVREALKQHYLTPQGEETPRRIGKSLRKYYVSHPRSAETVSVSRSQLCNRSSETSLKRLVELVLIVVAITMFL